MRDYLTSEIERRRAELTALEQQLAPLQQQHRALSDFLRILEELLRRAPSDDVERPAARARSVRRAGSEKGRLSAKWMPVLVEAVRRHPRVIRSDEVPGIQSAAGQEPSEPNNVRSHFWTNAQPGKFYERVRSGEYRATEAGARAAGIPLGGDAATIENRNGADHEPAPSSDFQNRDEPSISSDRLDLLNVHKASPPGGGT